VGVTPLQELKVFARALGVRPSILASDHRAVASECFRIAAELLQRARAPVEALDVFETLLKGRERFRIASLAITSATEAQGVGRVADGFEGARVRGARRSVRRGQRHAGGARQYRAGADAARELSAKRIVETRGRGGSACCSGGRAASRNRALGRDGVRDGRVRTAALELLGFALEARYVMTQALEQRVAGARIFRGRGQRRLRRGEHGRDRGRVSGLESLFDRSELVEGLERALQGRFERVFAARAERDGGDDEQCGQPEVERVVELEHQIRPR
jgi:hypothetical protein